MRCVKKRFPSHWARAPAYEPSRRQGRGGAAKKGQGNGSKGSGKGRGRKDKPAATHKKSASPVQQINSAPSQDTPGSADNANEKPVKKHRRPWRGKRKPDNKPKGE